MTFLDTSVVVAAFASWHEHHRPAREALVDATGLIGHVAFESFAVLTRLPPPHRASPDIVVEFLTSAFPGSITVLPPAKQHRLLTEAGSRGLWGGAIYDALIAATAMHASEALVTLDRRALPTYEAIGADIRLVG